MTVSAETNRIEYTASASQTLFTYPFKIFIVSDIDVYVDGVLKTITTDYTVAGAGDEGGGNVTFVTAMTGGEEVLIIRVIPFTQPTDLVENDPFPADAVEDALDRVTMLTQQNNEELARTIKLAVTSTLEDIVIPETPNGFLKWNSDGTQIVPVTEATEIASAVTLVDLGNTSDVSKGAALVGQAIQTANGLTALRTITPAEVRRIHLKYHTTAGDMGSGIFRGVTGASAGTYTDNNGTIIVPSGGDGSTAWIREYDGAKNVGWFGAVGDGVADDTTAFQSTVSACVLSDAIVIPEGEYKLTGEVDCSAKNLKISGVFAGASRINFVNANGNVNVFKTTNATIRGLIVENIRFMGNRDGTNDEIYGYPVYASSSDGVNRPSGVMVINCVIGGMSGTIYTKQCDRVRVTNNNVLTTSSHGANASVAWIDSCKDVVVAYNKEVSPGAAYSIQMNSTPGGTPQGEDVVIIYNNVVKTMALRHHKRTRIVGNRIDRANADGWSGALLITNGMEDTIVAYNELRGADGNTNLGGVLRVTDGATRLTVLGNTMRSYGGIGNGISVGNAGYIDQLLIIGNTVIDESGTNVNRGIWVEPAVDGTVYEAVIASNYITGFTLGIFAYALANKLDISNNRVEGSITASIKLQGLADGTGDNKINNNITSHDIIVNKGDNVIVSLNRCPRIFSETANNIIISNNFIYRTGQGTIQVEGDFINIEDNILIGDGTGGAGAAIWVTSAANHALISGNTIKGLTQTSGVGIRVSGLNTLVKGNKVDTCWRGLQTDAGCSYATGGNNLITGSGAGGPTSFAGTSLAGSLY